MKNTIAQALAESAALQISLTGEADKLVRAAEIIIGAFKAGNKILAVGNGGAASDAQHFTAEFVATFKGARPALPAICLNSNVSTITAWTNDFTFDTLYERQVEAFGKKGDVLIALSSGGGSLEPGRSVNIAFAARKAKEMGLHVIGLTGKTGGALKDFADPCFIVKSDVTARIQEAHMTLFHIITELVDDHLFRK